MSCGTVMYDYIQNLCYVIPCEYQFVSMNYFQRLYELGIINLNGFTLG